MKEVRDNIDLQDPLKSFRPGIFEPDDLSDNAPMKLFHLCAKYLVTHINLNPLTRKLPSEVCDNLIEIFRMIGSKSMCGRFLSEIDSKRSRVQDANLSGLEMKNKELFEFVDSHAKTIRMLNILECNRLLPNDVLNKTIETLIQVKDPFRLQREVVCYEVDESMSEADPIDLKYQGYRFAWMKRYHNQRLTTITPKDTSQKYFIEPFPIDFDKANNRFDVTHIHVPKPLINDYESFQAMGLFDEIGFCELYSQFTPTTIVTESGRRIMIWEGNGQEFIDLNEECGVNKNGCMPMYPICSVPIEDLGEEDLEELEEDAFLAGTDVTGANSTNNVGLNSGGNGGSSSSSAIRSLWSINYNRNLFPPKKRMSNMNEQSKPYGRITRSSSSAAHTSGWINKMNNNASTSSVGSTPSSNPPMTTTTAAAINDVHMREEITDNAMLDGSNNVRENGQNFETEDDDDDDVQPNRFRPISVQHHQPPDINHPHQQVILPTTSIAVTSSNLLASSGSVGGSATSSSCPSLESSVYFAFTGSSSSASSTGGCTNQSQASGSVTSHSNNSGVFSNIPGGSTARANSHLAFSYQLNGQNNQHNIHSNHQHIPSHHYPHHHHYHNHQNQQLQHNQSIPPNNVISMVPTQHHDSTSSSSPPPPSQPPSSSSQSSVNNNIHHPITRSVTSHSYHNCGNGVGPMFHVTHWPSTWSSSSPPSPPSFASCSNHHEYCTSINQERSCNPMFRSISMKFFPYQVYRYRGDNNRSKIIEIRTWEECPIETLMIGRSTCMFSDDKPSELPFTANQVSEMLFHPQLNNLKRLVIHDWPVDVTSFIKLQLYPAQAARIQHLDLSNCLSIDDGRRLLQLPQLKTLILFNCPNVYKALDNICELKSLRVLDISTSIDTTNSISHQFHEPDQQLSKIVKKLTNLTSLDISGTNLAGLRTDTIIGLEPRNGNPLDFLGIFHTSIEAASRENIPALRIAGDVGENMILTACEAYMNRVDMLRKGLNELFQLFRYESRQHNLERALKILVCSLGRHPSDKLVQVAASATLFYIVKSDEAKPLLGRRIKELIVTRLLDAMQAFRYDQTMLRNGCLNLIHFRIPSDVISEYTRLADILLYIVTNDDDNFVQRLGIYLLNSLACQVDGEQKTIVGNLGAIEKMLQLIEIRFNRSLCDEVMETAWSTMWNVTDETPINCERFLNNNGMEFFVSCMDKFSDCPELLRNMMGLLGNVSECAHLRYRLMKQDYISRFIILLASQSDGIEVSYNSAGILAHIASDGPEIWNRHLEKEKCSREDMLMKMKTAISRWEINSKRNINYRSFEPILRLLRVLSISWQAQYWAVWALANLTRVHCSKYCTLLEKDGGVEVLKYFVTAQRPDNFRLPISVKCLAVVTLFQYFLFRKFKNLKGLDTSDKIMCFYSVPSYLVGEFFHEYDFVHVAEELHINLSAVPQPRIHNQNLGILMENNTVNQRDCDNFEAYDEFNMNYRGLAADEQNVREQDEDEDMLF